MILSLINWLTKILGVQALKKKKRILPFIH